MADDGTPRYMDAINRALADEMAADESVTLLGVDIGRGGGAYGVTRELYDRFGEDRVIDTPIAEAGVLGAAVGAAMAGLRPVAEIMYMDFVAVCLDPIVNQAAKLRYMTGGGVRVPIVFRTQTGGGRSAGAQHSQSLEGMLAHVPGLHVYCPADARDAYDLLVAAIRADHPVCFVENRRLYGKRHGAWDREPLPPGRARVVRPGDDVTVVTWGRMVVEAQAAIVELGDEVSVELIDLRTLVPLDVDTIVASVSRTGRCLVVHEAVERFGPGGEIVARVTESALFDLDGPVRRYGAMASPVPYSPGLERAVLPDAAGVADAIRQVAAG
ncbi:MAG: acetoin:2,6-dichlorophenolindophenol oxidoreductase subunit beta [Solirubrobacteraceae bacterium]|nr:acetoin:2,6-dichlorophenolindophenol oxidoreductase subunit beta [Solirubrobacteraceae bacterium]